MDIRITNFSAFLFINLNCSDLYGDNCGFYNEYDPSCDTLGIDEGAVSEDGVSVFDAW